MVSSSRDLLFAFEERYPCLYDVRVGGVPLYTALRDGVASILRGTRGDEGAAPAGKPGRVYPLRVLATFAGLRRHRRARTLVFTSAVYRRDRGRNLAAEWLMERYPDAVTFEWPSRSEAFDSAYFADLLRGSYVPLDGYLALYKLHSLLHRRRAKAIERDARERLAGALASCPPPADERQREALDYVLAELPVSCAKVSMSQEVFRWLFRRYGQVEASVDFWGAARENITPVLPGRPESVELQHGIITAEHPGYAYPPLAGELDAPLFRRKMLVYDEGTKRVLTEESIFDASQVEVVGNPRVALYKREFGATEAERDLVLFTSQPYEQDGAGQGYYAAVIPQLARLREAMAAHPAWKGARLAVKLHPREDDAVAALFREGLPGVEVFGRASELYDLLCRTRLHLTVSSTVLYEAAEFGVPTALVPYAGVDAEAVYGVSVPIAKKEDLDKLFDEIQSYGKMRNSELDTLNDGG